MLKDIAVIIVNWNSNELVVEQVKNLSKFVEEIIVVDNNSDVPLSTVLKKSEHCLVIQNTYNRGFASACNQGLTLVTKKWTVFLNPDVTITRKNLADFETYASENRVEAVSVATDNDNYSKPVPTVFNLVTEFTFLRSVLPLQNSNQNKSLKTLIGGILFINTKTLKKIGGWDERFFLWFEDSDLTKQLLDAFIPIGFCKTDIAHIGGQSVKKLSTIQQKDLFFHAMNVYAKKHFSSLGSAIIKLISLRYSKKKYLPTINEHIDSIIFADSNDLSADSFLNKNGNLFVTSQFSKNYEVVIVTDSISPENVFTYRLRFPVIRFIPLAKKTSQKNKIEIGRNVVTGKIITVISDSSNINLSTLVQEK
jgi:GT2 family glycosyltransferase